MSANSPSNAASRRAYVPQRTDDSEAAFVIARAKDRAVGAVGSARMKAHTGLPLDARRVFARPLFDARYDADQARSTRVQVSLSFVVCTPQIVFKADAHAYNRTRL
jgi:hypothetical protein